ncbi:MAG: AGE family epimerase/isomerase [Oscillospiraceae bacterium]|jgi:mannobiose 2-epimerase|nr:AGE family epimerase/isomerase [Oscillospiraceae bacterium]
MYDEIKNELTNHIIPFWNALADRVNGGFYGYMSHDLKIDGGYDKGTVLHSRILWFYSNCYLVLKEPVCLEMARHCYDFAVKNCVDREYGGVYWSVKFDGTAAETMKHGYCQAFFIYALASYYDASGDESALGLATEIFNAVEEKLSDGVSYREACTREWGDRENDELSENNIAAEKTMNTVLHLIEAYTELYRVRKDERVAERLEFLLSLTYEKIYDKENARLLVFFDKDMNVRGNIHSYGHDIEAAWLMGRALDIAGDALPRELRGNVRAMNRALAEKIRGSAFDGDAMNYESVSGVVNTARVWWAQAEALTGFLDAYRLYGEERFLEKARGLWAYIKSKIIDARAGGEWHSQVDKNGVPAKMPVVDEWKCPYHNGRMCLMAISVYDAVTPR